MVANQLQHQHRNQKSNMNWLRSMFSDGTNGSVSSKRVVTFLAFVICAWGFIASVVGYHVDPKLFDSMMYIVVAGLGLTASEKFANK
jgi:hypothetical protein